MRVDSIREKARRTLDIKGVRGVDLNSAPVNVEKSRASYMKNMISEGGTNHKRRGFSAVMQFLDAEDKAMRINGMHVYYGADGDELIIHAGNTFYRENGTRIDSEADIANAKSQAFFINNKLYILGCGGILVYDGTKITGVEPYIPLVMTGGDYRYSTAKTVDGVNLLTRKRTIKLDGTPYSEDGYGLFKFDSSTDFSKDVTINVKMSVANNEIRLQEGDAPNPDIDTVYATMDIDLTFVITADAVDEKTEGGAVRSFTVKANDFTVNGKKAYIFNAEATGTENRSVEPLCIVGFNCSQFGFNFKSTPTVENELNIEVRYESESDGAEQINGCTFGAVIGDDNNATRLIISGNGKYSNMCYISDSFHMEGCAFFPDTNYISVGDSRPVTAFLRLSDASLGIFKDQGFYRYDFEFLADSQTFVTSLKTSGFKSADSAGCVNPYTAINVNSDSLVFTGESICGIESSSLNSSVERYLRVRSSRIEKALKNYGKTELKNATACEYQGRYYLFVNGDAYVGDTRYKTYESNKLDSSYEYEWWVWDNVDARCVAVYKDKLYIGTDAGLVKCENEEYRDIGIVKQTRPGDVLYNDADSSFVISDIIGVEEGAKVKIQGIEGEFDLVADGEKYYVKDSAGNNVKWSGTEEPVLTVFEVKNVRAVYHTPMLDLGTSIQTKTLYKIAVTAGIKDIGYLKVGYETHKSDTLTFSGESGFDFNKLDFNVFNFDFNFAKTYAVRTFERNFNYIMLRVESDENRDMSIEGITLIYVINNIITGVR